MSNGLSYAVIEAFQGIAIRPQSTHSLDGISFISLLRQHCSQEFLHFPVICFIYVCIFILNMINKSTFSIESTEMVGIFT